MRRGFMIFNLLVTLMLGDARVLKIGQILPINKFLSCVMFGILTIITYYSINLILRRWSPSSDNDIISSNE